MCPASEVSAHQLRTGNVKQKLKHTAVNEIGLTALPAALQLHQASAVIHMAVGT